MSAPWYERLTAADRSFLVFEGRHTHMHVGGTTIFEGGSLVGPDGAVDVDRIREYIGSRLHLIPRYRQRLARGAARGLSGLGRRRAPQPALPRAPREPAAAGRHAAAQAARGAHHVAAARPPPPAVGGLDRRRPRGRSLRAGAEDAPLRGRRHLGRRPDVGAAAHRADERIEPAAPPWTPRPAPDAARHAARRAGARPLPPGRAGAERRRTSRDLPRAAGQLGETAASVWEIPPLRHAAARRHADQPADRPLPALRLGEREPGRREGGEESARRDGERRRPHHGRRGGAPLPDPPPGRPGRRSTSAWSCPSASATASEHGTLGNRVAGWLLSLPIQEDDPRAVANASARPPRS